MLWKRLQTAATYWVEDQAAQMGAALAYYALFSLAPLLIIAITLVGQACGTEAARAEILHWVRESTSDEGAAAVQTLLDHQRHLPEGPGAWLLGIATLCFGAVSVFTHLRACLHRIWRLPRPTAQHVVVGFVRTYLFAILMVLLTCVFFLVLLVASTALTLLREENPAWLPADHLVWLVDFVTSGLLLLVLFAFTYRFLSDGAVRYRYVWGGALVSAGLFTVGKMAVGFYLARSEVPAGFGAAGSLVVLLIWVYYSAQIFFFGAEVIRVRLER